MGAAALATVAYTHFHPPPGQALLVAEACGLALFALSGAEIAEKAGHSPLIIILMGTMTGVAGGVLRDVVTSKVPLILQKDIYATAVIAGISVYLVLKAYGLKRTWASVRARFSWLPCDSPPSLELAVTDFHVAQ